MHRKLRDTIKLRRQIKGLKQRAAHFFTVNPGENFLFAMWPIEALRTPYMQRTLRGAYAQTLMVAVRRGEVPDNYISIQADGVIMDGAIRVAAYKGLGRTEVFVCIHRKKKYRADFLALQRGRVI